MVIEMINKIKSCFFENTKLTNLYLEKKKDSLNKWNKWNQKWKKRHYNWYDTNTKDHKRLLWTIILQQIEQPGRNKILETYNLSRLNHYETENLNKSITSKNTQ